MYTETFAQFKKHLGQFALERQVQIACDTVKLGHSYLTGKAAQPQEDNEKTRRTADARSVDHHVAGRA